MNDTIKSLGDHARATYENNDQEQLVNTLAILEVARQLARIAESLTEKEQAK